jgi:predicted AlkP superfamily pyrophosphatase or phosphodiesterase
LLALAALGAGAVPMVAQGAPPTLLLLSIDGLRPADVLEAGRIGARVPHLSALVRNGSFARGVLGVLPTVTYPSHATLVTGVAPAEHGIEANTTFDPLQRNQGGWYWYASDLRAPTLWDAARAAGRRTVSVHWPVSVGAGVDRNLPQIWRTGLADDRKLLRALATSPAWLDSLEREVGRPYPDGIDETIAGDVGRAAFMVHVLRREQPEVMTAYFAGLDHEEHASGPGSPAALAGLATLDSLVGELVSAARAAAAARGRGAVIAVVSDHGFEATTRAVHLNAALREAGLIELAGQGAPVLWRAMFWASGGSAALMLKERGDTAALRRARAVATRLLSDSSSGVAAILEREALDRSGAWRDAAFAVALRPGWLTGAGLDGPITSAASYRGMHGYPPGPPSLDASFFVAGPGIAAGRDLGRIDMRDIAPTLAGLIGLSLPSATGRMLSLSP